MSRHSVAALLSITVLATLVAAGRPVAASDLPHILLIMVDDMGYGDPGCFNRQSRIETPHIDQLARQGMRLTDAHAPGPLCHLSRYGLMTGRYPFRTKVSVWPKQPVIEENQVTLASLLQERGYRTAMVGKWHLGFAENGYDQPLPGGPIDRGFDSFFGIRASTDIPPYFYIRGDRAVSPPTSQIAANHSEGWSPIQGAFWRAGGIAPGLELKDVLPTFTSEAIKVIRDHAPRQASQPLMLYVAFPAPHTPWLPDEEHAGRSRVGMYGDFTMMVDTMIGRILSGLENAGMADNTLVILTSDNGPVWYPEDVERFGHDSAGGLRGMKADAWEAGHRMPFIVRWPGKIAAGSQSAQTICFTDLLATFAAITEAKLADDAGPDSFNLLPVLLGQQPEDQPIRGPLVIASGNGTMTIRRREWKLIEGLGSGGFTKPSRVRPGPADPPGQLYNLQEDQAEQKNLYQDHPDIVAALQAQLRQIQSSPMSR